MKEHTDFMRTARGALVLLAAVVSMAHVGSPDTFFAGKAGPYDVRVTVRLPGVIPGRAQVVVRVVGATMPDAHRVLVRAGQWDVGLEGAPPPDVAVPVPGDPSLYAAELWFMSATSYQLAVDVNGPSGSGTAIVPVLALATAEGRMPPWLGGILSALGLFLAVGFLTIIGSAVRESVLPPDEEPDARRRRRARFAVAGTAVGVFLILWGGNTWWAAEAGSYSQFVVYRPFTTQADTTRQGDRHMLTLSIRDARWNGTIVPNSRYNALLPDHGKLMHLFLVREPDLDVLAHLHPIARNAQGLDFDADLPPVVPGRYRVYGDIVHESGYAQTLVSTVEISGDVGRAPSDPDDSWFSGQASAEAPSAKFAFPDGSVVTWQRGETPLARGDERVLTFVLHDAAGRVLPVEPYMGMAAHAIVASRDGSVFVHLHPSGSISMAALQKFSGVKGAEQHAGHEQPLRGEVAIPYAFPQAGRYRLWVQFKQNGVVKTAAFDAAVSGQRPVISDQ